MMREVSVLGFSLCLLRKPGRLGKTERTCRVFAVSLQVVTRGRRIQHQCGPSAPEPMTPGESATWQPKARPPDRELAGVDCPGYCTFHLYVSAGAAAQEPGRPVWISSKSTGSDIIEPEPPLTSSAASTQAVTANNCESRALPLYWRG